MVNKYLQLEYFFVDNVYFHSSLWKLAQFKTPIVYHPYLGQINIFGDHFHPAIILISLLFRLFPYHQTIFISMSLTYALGAYFAFLIAQKLIKNNYLPYLLIMAYFLYIGTQNAFLFGFHEINLLPTFFFFAVWALIEKKWPLYWLGLALILLTKESMLSIALGIGFFSWFYDKKHRKVAIITSCVAIIWYLLVTKVIIPHFSAGQFLYGSVSIPNSLSELIKRLTQPSDKIHTFLVSIANFGFLPILNLAALPLVLQDFFIRYVFAIPGNVQYLLTYHYGVALAPMLLLSSIYSVHLLEKTKKAKLLIPLFALLTAGGIFYNNFMLSQRAPFLMVFNKGFYQSTKNNAFLWPLIEAVPADGSVMTQNHLGLPLSKQDTHMLADSYKELMKKSPDYLVFDLRDGQNPNNFFPTNQKSWEKVVEEATESGSYQEYFQTGDLYILKKQ